MVYVSHGSVNNSHIKGFTTIGYVLRKVDKDFL